MTRALVIRTMGDQSMADEMAKALVPVEPCDIALIREEFARLKAECEIRAYGDRKRLRTARKEMARKYSTKRHGAVYGALMGLYGLACYGVALGFKNLAEWNRR